MESSGTLKRTESASPSMNPISPTTLDNLSMNLRERNYDDYKFKDDISSPLLQTPKSGRRVLDSRGSASPMPPYRYLHTPKRSPTKPPISPSKNYSESVNRQRATARGSPIKQRHGTEEMYKWSSSAQIDSLKDENTKLHRDLEKADFHRKENVRLQKELDKLENIKVEHLQSEKDKQHWKIQSERCEEEIKRLKASLELKDAKLTHQQLEIERLTKLKREQASTIAENNRKINELRRCKDLGLEHCSKLETYVDIYAGQIEELRSYNKYLKEKLRDQKEYSFGKTGGLLNKQVQTERRNRDVASEGSPSLSKESAKESASKEEPDPSPAFRASDNSDSIVEKVASILLGKIGTENSGAKGNEPLRNGENLDVERLADALLRRLTEVESVIPRSEGQEFSKRQGSSSESSRRDSADTHQYRQPDVESVDQLSKDDTPSVSKSIEELRKEVEQIKLMAQSWASNGVNKGEHAAAADNCNAKLNALAQKTNTVQDNGSKHQPQINDPVDSLDKSQSGSRHPSTAQSNAQTQTYSIPTKNLNVTKDTSQVNDDSGQGATTKHERFNIDKSTQTLNSVPSTAQAEYDDSSYPKSNEECQRDSSKFDQVEIDPQFAHIKSSDKLSSQHEFYTMNPRDSMCVCHQCQAIDDYTNSRKTWVA
ncbi:hypothetical protein I9W82_004561 [Candida metapsilosis]|uniref:Uncharacterized protein n=1 Tax=Candida metapsilosis TaxID=273372 RepID=A0A8H8D9J7_9ASCO|nr:hypothetical protein I9W82_004561 [Candida metapsilosis]